MKEEYGHTIDNLRYRLEISEVEIDKLRNVRAIALNTSAASPERDFPPDRQQDLSRELKVEERESGEVRLTALCRCSFRSSFSLGYCIGATILLMNNVAVCYMQLCAHL